MRIGIAGLCSLAVASVPWVLDLLHPQACNVQVLHAIGNDIACLKDALFAMRAERAEAHVAAVQASLSDALRQEQQGSAAPRYTHQPLSGCSGQLCGAA